VKSGTVKYLSKAVLLAAVYALFARLGLSIEPVNAFATLVWPPTGIALASLLILGNRFWPSVAAGAVAANIWTGAPPLVALGIGAGNTLEALLGAYALSRIPGFRRSLDRLQDVIGLVLLAGALSTAVSATIGVASLFLGGIITPDRIGVTWRAWWLGDAIGDLVVAPLLLTWKPAPDAHAPRGRVAEAGLLGILLVAASLLIFDVTSQDMPSLLLPLLVWAAIRFDERGAARATFVVSAIAVWATLRGHGPFVRVTIPEGLFSLQVFVGLTAATFLVLGAVMSERRRAEAELRRTKDEAEAANHAKDQFLAALSHELRTPLTPVLALSSVLEEDPELPPDTRQRIQIVRRNAEIEARLIDDLLDLTRIAKGKLQLEVESVELAEALDDVVEICRPEAAAKGLVIEREGADRGKFVDADPARLKQIFWNIVKNAIKFTPRGGRILLRAIEPAPGRIAVEVLDTGVGIDPAEIKRIFLPFEQAGQRAGGLGLGLAISNALVEAHGGTLVAASGGLGRGATFRVELALSSVGRPRRQQATSSAVGSPGEARRVLLVEDHGDTLGAAQDLLNELSCRVVTAATLQEALAAAKSQAFDLVISDLGLPDGSGLDLMRSLRDSYGLAGIAVTGYGMEADLRRSLEAGFVEHLVKPITFQRLAGAVERFFATRRPPDSTA
jgi:signal transduction histidine kinase/ActR/RegA family two-component response regulator